MVICPRHMLPDKVTGKFFWKLWSEKEKVSEILHNNYFSKSKMCCAGGDLTEAGS